MAAAQRVTIGFGGTQVLGVKVDDGALEALLKALPDGDWHDLTVEDGTIRLNLSEVVYVRTELDELKVGFGLGG
jgi:hypothetical protein